MPKKRDTSMTRVVWPSSTTPPLPRQVQKIGRNAPCPCGSGKKYKDCHQNAGDAFLIKLAREREKKELREVRQHLKAQGVPWYKRLFFRP